MVSGFSASLPQALEEFLSWDEIACFGGGLSFFQRCCILSNRSYSWPVEDLFHLVDQASLAALNTVTFVSSSVHRFTFFRS